MSHTTFEAPPHVLPELIVDFDYMHPPGIEDGDVYAAWARLHDGPDIVWTFRNGGHWILTRAEDMRWVQTTHEIFSHEEFLIPRGSTNLAMPPLTVDPPLHTRYRAVLNPYFTPSRVRNIATLTRRLTVDQIEKLKPRGQCDFINEFARVMPVIAFMNMANLPLERREECLNWAQDYIRSDKPEVREASTQKIVAYLRAVLDERVAAPGDDLFSGIAAWRNSPRYSDESEVIGMAFVTFFGGLDTVANLVAFTFAHFAQHAEHRRRVRENPSIIPQVVEEFIRRYGLSTTGRLVKKAVDRKGIRFAAGDMVMVSNPLASMDDRLCSNPSVIDFDRGVVVHNTFSHGPHKCVGAPLARAELAIFIEEWLTRIPEFRIDPALPPRSYMAKVVGLSQLGLVWD
jgi:cytochrome P450